VSGGETDCRGALEAVERIRNRGGGEEVPRAVLEAPSLPRDLVREGAGRREQRSR